MTSPSTPPPDKEFSARADALKLCALGYHVLPIRPRSKAAAAHNWTTVRLTTADQVNANFDRPELGLGLLLGVECAAGVFPVAVDVDIDDPLLISRIGLAFALPPPAKKGAKGITFIARADGPSKKRRFTRRNAAGTNFLVLEILASGQQTVLPPSIHPSGVKYEWVGAPLTEVAPAALPHLLFSTLSEIELAVRDPDSPLFLINDMDWHGVGGGGTVHDSVLRAVASMVAHKWTEDAVWASVDLACRRQVEKAGDVYEWRGWEKTVRDMVRAAHDKGFDEPKKQKPALRVARWLMDDWAGPGRIFNRDGQLSVYRDGHYQVLPAADARHVVSAANENGLTHNELCDVLNTVLDLLPRMPPPPHPRVCLLNGTFCMDQMKLNPWAPDDYLISQLSFDHRPDAVCPVYEGLLADVFRADDPSEVALSIGLFEEFVAHTLFECLDFQKFLVLKGEPGTGKSTLLKVVRMLHSPRAVAAVGVHDFGNERFRAAMAGRLLNVATEVAATSHMADDFLKAVTAGDEIQVRYLYREPEMMRLPTRLIFACNEMFKTRDHSGAIERRMLVLPCVNRVPDDRQDPWIVDKIRMELPGVFNRMTEAWARLRVRSGFLPTASQRTELETFTVANDNVLQWFRERTHQGALLDDPAHTIPADGAEMENPILYLDYAEWARANGYRQVSSVSWGMRVAGLGYKARVQRVGDRTVRMRPLGLLKVGF